MRRMVRCRLARSLPANTLQHRCAAGAFAVKKDEHADRLIGDRRPLNAGERQPGPVRLPYASRLRRMQLPWGKGIWTAKRDLRNCFYLWEVEPSRLERQVIGPRIPRSWLHDIENESEDDRLSFECWFTPDLYLSATSMGVDVDESAFCQVALSGVMMGDVGAVAVIQEAHTRLLLANRVLEPEELIGGSPFAWDGEVRGDVYIDDLVVMIVGEMYNGPPPEIVRRLEAADAAYGSHGMPVKRDKSEDPALTADFWGATLHGGSGRYGFNLERRASLAATTLFALAFGGFRG